MKPKVVIALSIYKPNLKWLEELLISLNNQTYQNIELLVWNDFPEDKYEYNRFFSKYIKNFKFYIKGGDKNLGVNGAFEELTRWAEGDYIAYCDQDDIWIPEKIEKMVKFAECNNLDLTACFLKRINKNSKNIGEEIIKVSDDYENNRIGKFKYSLMHTLINGCAMLLNLDIAKKALPFPKINNEYHDYWLSLYVTAYGRIGILKECLIKYRVYDNNTSTMYIGSKKDYLEKRLLTFKNKIEIVYERFLEENFRNDIKDVLEFANCRVEYFCNPTIKNFYKLFVCYRNYNFKIVLFEILQPILSNKLFLYIVNKQIKSKFFEVNIKELVK